MFTSHRAPSPFSLRDALNAAFRDRRRIVLGMLAVFALSLVIAFMKTQYYTARTSLLVLMSAEYASRPDALATQATTAVSMEHDSIMNSEVSILISHGLARSVVDRLGVARLYPGLQHHEGLLPDWLMPSANRQAAPADLAAERFSRDLSAVPDKAGSTIEVTYRNSDKTVAAEALNALIEVYQQKRAEVYSNAQSSLIQVESEKAGESLKRISAELASYQSQQGISDFGTQMDLLLRRRAELQREQQSVDTTFAESTQRIATITAQLRHTPSQVREYTDSESDKRIQAARDGLTRLLQQESELRQTYTDESQKVLAVRRQIAATRADMARMVASDTPSAVRNGSNPVSTSLQLDLMRAESENSAARESRHQLQSQAAAVDAQIHNLEQKRVALDDLIRQKSLAEHGYVTATRALEERRIAEGVDSKKPANVRVIEAAVPPLEASRTRLVIVAGGAGLSLLAGLAIGVLSDRFRRSFISPGRIERDVGVPVLATVSHNRHLRPLKSNSRTAKVVAERVPAAG